MNKELVKLQPKVSEGIVNYLKQDLLQFNFYMPEKFEVQDEEGVKVAEKNIKIATSEKTRILAETKEVKQFLDEQKKPILEYEKKIESLVTQAKSFFDAKIQAYKTKKAEEQRAINARINEIHRQKNLAIQSIVNTYNLQNTIVSKMQALVQKWEIDSAKIPDEQIEDAIEILETVQAKIEAEVVPIEIVTQEKNYVVERLIEDKEEYSIGNEQEFIEWCLANKEYSLLDIKPKKSVFNSWVKLNGNKNHSFVKITVSKK